MRLLAPALSITLLVFRVAAAEQTSAAAAPSAPVPIVTPTPASSADLSKPPALKVIRRSLPHAVTTTPAEMKAEEARQTALAASLGDSIVLKTSSELADYLDYAVKQKKSVTLFLDGNDTFLTPEKLDRQQNELQFHLERNADNKKVWAALLRDPFHHQTRQVEASVGLAGGSAVPADQATFKLVVVQWAWYAWAWLLLLLVLVVVFGWLVAKRDMLRDGKAPNPYSLGRCQMAWWFFLIIVAYVMIWLVSGDQDTITGSLLALMGISAGTALGAVLIDSTGGSAALSQAATDRLALLAAQQNAQQNEVAAQTAATAAPADPVVQKNLEDTKAAVAIVDAKLLVVNNQLNGIVKVPQTRGFFRDILSDSTGTVGLHRFQIIVWTVVLGIIFLVSVVTELSMPEFSATLLATMGISAGTYLGFKFPEK